MGDTNCVQRIAEPAPLARVDDAKKDGFAEVMVVCFIKCVAFAPWKNTQKSCGFS
jgi:hypothetical protein